MDSDPTIFAAIATMCLAVARGNPNFFKAVPVACDPVARTRGPGRRGDAAATGAAATGAAATGAAATAAAQPRGGERPPPPPAAATRVIALHQRSRPIFYFAFWLQDINHQSEMVFGVFRPRRHSRTALPLVLKSLVPSLCALRPVQLGLLDAVLHVAARANSISMRIAPRPLRCGPTNCGCGSLPWPTYC
jgi:hypothetical protein